ncbi:MAG: 2-C-methyl-D-erythritol 2,4-cyclodiphosphate synthase [Candidatus Dormibacteria bacterium]
MGNGGRRSRIQDRDAANAGETATRSQAPRDEAFDALTPPSIPSGARAGIGFDAHRLEAGRRLRLGGVTFPDEPRGLAGHSDGDAALHALIDALLGAAHLGDIGTLFPPDEERWRHADSAHLLRLTVQRLIGSGWRPRVADLVIVADAPTIHPVRDRVEARIAELLGLDSTRVSVKGTTSDGLGIAAGGGVAAYALATIEPAPPPRRPRSNQENP